MWSLGYPGDTNSVSSMSIAVVPNGRVPGRDSNYKNNQGLPGLAGGISTLWPAVTRETFCFGGRWHSQRTGQ